MLYTKAHGNRISGSKVQDFKAFQNVWAWKQSGHVTNVLISSYLKVYIQNFVEKAKWFLLLALKFDLNVKMSRSIHGDYLYTP